MSKWKNYVLQSQAATQAIKKFRQLPVNFVQENTYRSLYNQQLFLQEIFNII